MSIVGAWVTGEFLFLAGDTRVTRHNDKGRLVSQYDFSQKVFEISSNIIIGFAGDYKSVKLIERLRKKLNKPNISGQFLNGLNNSLVIKEIQKIIQSHWDNENSETDFLVGIHDLRSEKNVLYKILGFNLQFYKLDENELHLIGLDASKRRDIKIAFIEILQRDKPKTMEELGNCLIQSLKNEEDETISRNINCLALASDGNYAINSGTGYIGEDGGVNWVVDSLHEKWTRLVNGKEIGQNTDDFAAIDDRLNKKLK